MHSGHDSPFFCVYKTNKTIKYNVIIIKKVSTWSGKVEVYSKGQGWGSGKCKGWGGGCG